MEKKNRNILGLIAWFLLGLWALSTILTLTIMKFSVFAYLFWLLPLPTLIFALVAVQKQKNMANWIALSISIVIACFITYLMISYLS